jgi:integrase
MATIVKARQRAGTEGSGTRKPWTVRYQLDGRQRERSFRTKREAEDFKARFEHESREQSYVDPKLGSEQFADAAARWIDRHPGAPRTKVLYGSVLRNQISPAIGDRTLATVARDRDMVSTLLLVTMPGNGVGPSHVRTAYRIITAVVSDAVRAGKLPSHRLAGIKLPPVKARAGDFVFPTHPQIEVVADAMPDQYRLTIWLMRGCGLRIGEALGVRESDFINGTLRLSRQMLENGETGPLKHRKDGDYRDIPVPSYVGELAKGHEAFAPVNRRMYTLWFSRAKAEAGIAKGFTPHSLRHVFASVALANGISITDVSRWLGHASIQTTFSIYGHLVPSSWDAAREALDKEYGSWRDSAVG